MVARLGAEIDTEWSIRLRWTRQRFAPKPMGAWGTQMADTIGKAEGG